MRMSLKEWVSSMLGLTQENYQTEITGFAIDSREVVPGNVFFALPGERTDGHYFLQRAAKSGAVAAIVADQYKGDSFGMELISVADPKQALRESAQIKHSLFSGTTVGVTGSIGKTTVKVFAKTLLSPICKVYASPKSYNSQLTYPLSLLQASGNEDILLLEMGVSEPGNMQSLLEIAAPDIAIITHINEQHAAYFPNGIRGIVEEKSRCLAVSQVQILPKDSEWFPMLSKACMGKDFFSFALHQNSADFYYQSIQTDLVVIRTPDGSTELPVKFTYQPAYYNFLIAYALSWFVGVPTDLLIDTIPTLCLPPMRFEQVIRNGILIINDAYNACPNAMLAAIDAMPNFPGRRILVLGHMTDLGSYSEVGHAIVARKAVEMSHTTFFIGEHWLSFRHCAHGSCEVFFRSSKQEVEAILKRYVRQGDVILLKGSRSLALESLLACF